MTGFLDLQTSMTFKDLEHLKKRFLVNFSQFWMQRTFQHSIATKWLKIDHDNLRMKFSALKVDFSSLSFDPLGSWSPAQVGVKTATFPKKWLFYRSYLV